ncbi:hypothetical protein ACG7TL_004154 [Trametes sanguinea]
MCDKELSDNLQCALEDSMITSNVLQGVVLATHLSASIPPRPSSSRTSPPQPFRSNGMSLNGASINASRQPNPLPHELAIRSVDTGVEVVLQIPDATSGGSSTSSGSSGPRKLKNIGGIWLTDQRLIFVSAQPSQGSPQSFDSLTVPLTAIISTQFEQPRFAGNYLAIEIKASPGGGLVDGTRAEIRFKDKGIFEFTSVLEKTRERAIYMKRQSADEEEGLPPSWVLIMRAVVCTAAYTTPGPSGASTPYAAGDVPDENPPGYEESL